MKITRFLTALLFLFISIATHAQDSLISKVDIIEGVEYTIGGIQVTGAENLDKNVVIMLSGLVVGDKVSFPSDKVAKSINNLWKQGMFQDIKLFITERQGGTVFLEYQLVELPKLSRYFFAGPGVKKSMKDDLKESLGLKRNKIVTENLIRTTEYRIKKYYKEKGYLNATVDITTEIDTLMNNSVIMGIRMRPGSKVKVGAVNFHGNDNMEKAKLARSMKKTKEKNWNIFRSAKFSEVEYKADKRKLINKYNENGYRNARILKDSVYQVSPEFVHIDIWIDEGRQFYFRDITFLGNSKYSTETLERFLQIQKGDVYNSSFLTERVMGSAQGDDIHSLYLDNGYLFSSVTPVEKAIIGDSIDIEIRITEGRQATVNKVTVTGNDRTNDHVIYRELRTKPGDLFSRSDIQRTMRELSQLGYFDPQQLDVRPTPNGQTGTVDIEYVVAEQSTSQLELQGGWGGGRLVGTLGLNFNNFSAKNIMDGSSWKPLPTGDGQTISLRAQSNGAFFQSYSFSFTEPWLGGKKPNSFTVSVYHNIQSNGAPRGTETRQQLNTTGVNLSLGKRITWPDDYFTLIHQLEFRQFTLKNYSDIIGLGFTDGIANNVNYKFILSRNNTDQPIFPTKGAEITLTAELTPPFSYFNDKDYNNILPEDKYRWIEYHKWKLSLDWFSQIGLEDLVFRAHGEFGFLGAYNKEVGIPPLERFYLGGDGLQNFQLDGRDVIGLRGYPNQSITPPGGGTMYNKFSMELRYQITSNPSARIFVLGFFEGGTNVNNVLDYEPFGLKRSAGGGVRVFMPMFGLLGFDVGYGFDPVYNSTFPSGWQTHFIIGQRF
ncbi:MAG: outer membrane protein assembly factor BamA [Schleiferiaceae bacterium]|nr:outer membrane protein assembly factor BamA [Schleiferiaceae bacterium]